VVSVGGDVTGVRVVEFGTCHAPTQAVKTGFHVRDEYREFKSRRIDKMSLRYNRTLHTY